MTMDAGLFIVWGSFLAFVIILKIIDINDKKKNANVAE